MDEQNKENMGQTGGGETEQSNLTPPPEIREQLENMGHEAPAAGETTGDVEMPAAPKKSSSFGPVFGIIIIVILLVLAGFYFWGAALKREASNGAQPTATSTAAGQAASPSTSVGPTMSTSDSLNSIQADLNSTDLKNLDAEMSSVNSDLNQ